MVEVDKALANLSVLRSECDKLITDLKKSATPELSSTYRLPNSANPSSLDIFATAEEKDPFKDSSGSFRSQTTESSDEDSINSKEEIIRTQAGVFGIVDGKEKEAVLKVAEEKKKRVENNEKVGKDSDTWTLLSSSSGSKGKASPEKTKERE